MVVGSRVVSFWLFPFLFLGDDDVMCITTKLMMFAQVMVGVVVSVAVLFLVLLSYPMSVYGALLVADSAVLLVGVVVVIFQHDGDSDAMVSGAVIVVDVGPDLYCSHTSRSGGGGRGSINVVVREELGNVLRVIVVEVETFLRVVRLVDVCDAHHEDLSTEIFGAWSLISQEGYDSNLLEGQVFV